MTRKKRDLYFQEFLYIIYENKKPKALPKNIYIDILKCLNNASNGRKHNGIVYDIYGIRSGKIIRTELRNLCNCDVTLYNGLSTKYHLTDKGKKHAEWLFSN